MQHISSALPALPALPHSHNTHTSVAACTAPPHLYCHGCGCPQQLVILGPTVHQHLPHCHSVVPTMVCRDGKGRECQGRAEVGQGRLGRTAGHADRLKAACMNGCRQANTQVSDCQPSPAQPSPAQHSMSAGIMQLGAPRARQSRRMKSLTVSMAAAAVAPRNAGSSTPFRAATAASQAASTCRQVVGG